MRALETLNKARQPQIEDCGLSSKKEWWL